MCVVVGIGVRNAGAVAAEVDGVAVDDVDAAVFALLLVGLVLWLCVLIAFLLMSMVSLLVLLLCGVGIVDVVIVGVCVSLLLTVLLMLVSLLV